MAAASNLIPLTKILRMTTHLPRSNAVDTI
jgi:hypothetical protein